MAYTDVIKNTTLVNIMKLVYPVGSVYFNADDPTDPATLLGFGTWVAWGAGRVPVGFDAGDSDFNAPEKTGGAKTHTLTVAEMPPHSHVINTNDGAANNNSYVAKWDGTGTAQTQNTGSAGSGDPHNNLQPYITAYMWKRTA